MGRPHPQDDQKISHRAGTVRRGERPAATITSGPEQGLTPVSSCCRGREVHGRPKGAAMPKGSLAADFERLRAVTNAHQRGRKFEQLLERLFRQAHFRVDLDAGIATPRQTDLVARYGGVWYLIEAKWQTAPADVDVFDAVFRRLQRAASSRVVGVIVSVSGFTNTVIEEAAKCRGEELVLL